MKALVTGSEGFVGRHMVTELYRRGYRVEQCDLKTGDDLVDVCRSPLKTVYDLVVHCAFHVGGRAAIDGEPKLLARNLQLDSALFDRKHFDVSYIGPFVLAIRKPPQQ